MSDLLLDTHAVLWFFWDDPLLSSTAKVAIENADNRKLVSIASCWEIAIKTGLKKLQLGGTEPLVSPAVVVQEQLRIAGDHVRRRDDGREPRASPSRPLRSSAGCSSYRA